MADELALSRRSFLSTVAIGAGVVASGSTLAGCSGSSKGSGRGGGVTDPKDLSKVLPSYVPNNLVTPDIPSVNGSDPGYLTYPTDLVKTVSEVPGAGGSYTAVTPLWASIPPVNGNQYYAAVNKALGATLTMRPASGNDYQTILPTLFSGDKLPDWVQIPGWLSTGLNLGKATEQRFADLTPYLAGDKIKKYPNLANIPTAGWQVGVWNGKIYGIPVFTSTSALTGALYYRKDIFDAQGISEPKSADDVLAIGKEMTNAKAKRWAFDDLWTYLRQPFDNEWDWQEKDGKLIHRYESDQMIAEMEFMQKITKAGYVHPEAVAVTGDAKLRFASGQVVLYGDGTGGWGEAVRAQGLAGNKAFKMQASTPFSANGTDAPRTKLGNGAGWFSYLNKKLKPAQIEELLRIANYLAAPFGSLENTIVNYGADGVDYTTKSLGPELTATGKKEVATTYQFLVSPPQTASLPGYPDWVKAYTTWQQKALSFQYKPLFYGMNIAEPSRFAGIGQPMEDMMADVNRNRKSIADYKSALADWRRKGGDQLREFYAKLL